MRLIYISFLGLFAGTIEVTPEKVKSTSHKQQHNTDKTRPCA